MGPPGAVDALPGTAEALARAVQTAPTNASTNGQHQRPTPTANTDGPRDSKESNVEQPSIRPPVPLAGAIVVVGLVSLLVLALVSLVWVSVATSEAPLVDSASEVAVAAPGPEQRGIASGLAGETPWHTVHGIE